MSCLQLNTASGCGKSNAGSTRLAINEWYTGLQLHCSYKVLDKNVLVIKLQAAFNLLTGDP